MRLGRIDAETTANVGIIHGGMATNIVCPEVRIRAEARSRNPEKLASQVAQMKEAFHQAATDFGAEVNAPMSAGCTRCTGFQRTIPPSRSRRPRRETWGWEQGLRQAGGGSDANVFNALGYPSCVLATGMRQIHTHHECITIADLVQSARWVVEIVQQTVRRGARPTQQSR